MSSEAITDTGWQRRTVTNFEQEIRQWLLYLYPISVKTMERSRYSTATAKLQSLRYCAPWRLYCKTFTAIEI